MEKIFHSTTDPQIWQYEGLDLLIAREEKEYRLADMADKCGWSKYKCWSLETLGKHEIKRKDAVIICAALNRGL